MDRIPKYTAGMFKKKMPRFGASSIRMPRIPKPPKPRVKKFEGGGDVDEVIVSPEAGQKEYAELFARSERNKKQRELQQSKDLVKRYLSETKKNEDAAAATKKKAEEDKLKKQFDAYMEDRKKREQQGYSDYMREMKRGVRTARSGGKMSSCCRGDGIAKRGKTRGKMV